VINTTSPSTIAPFVMFITLLSLGEQPCSQGSIGDKLIFNSSIGSHEVEMTNKPTPVGIVRICLRFDGNPALTGYEYGYGYEEYGDVHIPAIIPVPTISPFSFKLLKSSQLIK